MKSRRIAVSNMKFMTMRRTSSVSKLATDLQALLKILII
jgi:hypothetical protein